MIVRVKGEEILPRDVKPDFKPKVLKSLVQQLYERYNSIVVPLSINFPERPFISSESDDTIPKEEGTIRVDLHLTDFMFLVSSTEITKAIVCWLTLIADLKSDNKILDSVTYDTYRITFVKYAEQADRKIVNTSHIKMFPQKGAKLADFDNRVLNLNDEQSYKVLPNIDSIRYGNPL